MISGGLVERCVLGPSVRVNSYAHVEDSILFEGVNVGRRAKIRRAIIDKGVIIPEDAVIGYDLEQDRRRGFARRAAPVRECAECRSGDVLTGRIKPTECPQFGVGCTPDSPLGAPMVSAEGACAAYFRYAPRKDTAEANTV